MSRRPVRIALVALVFTALVGCGLFMSPERRIARAENFIEQGDWGSAAIELRQALEAQPDNMQGRLLLARVAAHSGELQTARKELDRAIDLGAKPAATAVLDAEIRLGMGDFAALREATRQPIAGLGEPERLMYQGYAALGERDVAAALELFKAAVAASTPGKDALRVRTALAEGLSSAGETDAAISELDTVLKEDPQFARASVIKGMILVQRGQAEQGEAALLSAKLDQNSSLPQLQRMSGLAALAEAQIALRKFDDAGKTVQHLRRIAPNAVIGSYMSARLALVKNDPATAVTEMQKVVSAAPQFMAGRFLLAQALLASGSFAQAETELQAVLESNPDNVEARKLLADAQIRAGRPQAAVDSLFPAIQANTTDPQVYSLYGRAKFEEGDRESAQLFWERSLAAAGDDPGMKLSLAGSYIAAGDSRRALELLATVPDEQGGARKKQLQLIAMATGKDPALAREEVAALVQRNPGDVQLLGLAASWLISQKQYDQARGYLGAALKEKPDDVASLVTLARLEVAQKNNAAAEAALQKVLKANPNNGAALQGLAQLAAAQGDKAGAERWLQEWRTRDPKSAEARLILARQALASKDTDQGNKLIDEAIAVAPKQAGVANAAGEVLMEAGRYEEALKRFRDAIELSPESPEFLFNAARAQLALNQRQAARDSLGKALSIRPDWVPAVVLLAEIDVGDGRFDAALAAAEKLKKVPGTQAFGFTLEAQIRLQQKDYGAADRALAEAYRLTPTAETAFQRAGVRRAGKLPNPDEPLRAWLERQPQDARARFLLGESLQAQGDRAGAIREYEKGLEAAPNDPALLNNLAWLYSEAGDKRAEAVASKAYAAAPTAWPIADTYGWILVRSGKASEGLKILQQVSEKSGNNPEVLYHLGVAQAKSGDPAAAKATLAKAVAGAGSAPWKAAAEKAAADLK